MSKLRKTKNNFTARIIKTIPCTLNNTLSNDHSQLLAKQNSVHIPKRRRSKLYHCNILTETDVSSLTKELIHSGQHVYINVHGEKDQDIVRPVPIENINRYINKPATFSYYGLADDKLTKEERDTIDYLNSELTLKGAQHRIKDAIQGKITCDHSKENESGNHRMFYANKKQPFEQGNQNIDLTTINEKVDKSKEILLGRKSLGVELYKRQRRLTELSQETDGQLSHWMQKYRKHKRDNPPEYKSLESRRASVKLQNTDKYNIDYVEYLRKKTNRKIEKDRIDKVISRRDNVVEQYQEFMLRQMALSSKNKQNVRRCFDLINNETRRLFT